MQVNIDRKIEKIRKLQARELLLLPREHTLVHWSGIFCDAVRNFLPLAATVSNKKLWLKLIRIRLGEPGDLSVSPQLQPDDLVELALRKADLAKSERQLTKTLVTLDEKRKGLFARYNRLEIAQAMAEAAGSLPSRLGVDVDDALTSPTATALGEYLNWLTQVCSENTEPHRSAVRSHQRMDAQSSRLMRIAKRLITGMDEGRTPSFRNKERYRSMLAQLNDLEKESRIGTEAYRSAVYPPSPKLSGANLTEKR